jgi:hypothetical protein
VATCFGVRSHDGRVWHREEFDAWLRLEMAVPLRLDHGALLDPRGGLWSIGTARMFQPVRVPVEDQHIDGLLTLIEMDQGDWPDAILADIRRHLAAPWLPGWGLSLGAQHLPGEIVLPDELSLTMRPGFADALVLATGEAALSRGSC